MKNIENSECLVGFGKFLREGRERKGMLQSEVAQLVGISRSYVTVIEAGERNVDLILALKLCQAIGLDLGDFIKKFM